MRDFRQLRVWQEANAIVGAVYATTARFPRLDRGSLAGQMRRAAASVPSNIAEGAGRESDADYARFLTIALGSLSELESQLLSAALIGLGDPSVLHALATRTRKLRFATWRLRRALRAQS